MQQFSEGDQVVVLLPIVGSPFQAKFVGRYIVVWQLSEQKSNWDSKLQKNAPSKTQAIERDTDDAKSVRQRFYRVSEKRKVIDGEVECRLDNHIAVHSPSSWASLCLLVEKSDKSIRRCTDYRKDFPRVEDCIDQVGAAKYGNKFSLLKGTWQVPITPRAQTNICFHKTNWPVLIYSQGFWLMERTSYISTTHEYGS